MGKTLMLAYKAMNGCAPKPRPDWYSVIIVFSNFNKVLILTQTMMFL